MFCSQGDLHSLDVIVSPSSCLFWYLCFWQSPHQQGESLSELFCRFVKIDKIYSPLSVLPRYYITLQDISLCFINLSTFQHMSLIEQRSSRMRLFMMYEANHPVIAPFNLITLPITRLSRLFCRKVAYKQH